MRPRCSFGIPSSVSITSSSAPAGIASGHQPSRDRPRACARARCPAGSSRPGATARGRLRRAAGAIRHRARPPRRRSSAQRLDPAHQVRGERTQLHLSDRELKLPLVAASEREQIEIQSLHVPDLAPHILEQATVCAQRLVAVPVQEIGRRDAGWRAGCAAREARPKRIPAGSRTPTESARGRALPAANRRPERAQAPRRRRSGARAADAGGFKVLGFEIRADDERRRRPAT